MIQKIMVVDDDQKFRESISRSLTMNNFEVIEASNGKEALNVLLMEHVDLILSDVKMPQLNGIEFLHRVKREKQDVPFILMTGFSEVIEIKEAYEIGADGFLAKPYKENDLLHQIKKIDNAEETLETKDKFIAVAVDEFVAGANIKYPIYIKLDDGNFVKIANQGENLSSKQILEFKERQTEFFYLEVKDFNKFIEFNFLIKGSILNSSRIDPIKKVKFLKILTNHLTKLSHSTSLSPVILEQIDIVNNDQLKLILSNNELFNSFDTIISDKEKDYDLLSLSAFIASYLLNKLPWKSDSNAREVFYASVFQSIEATANIKEIPFMSYKKLLETNLFDDQFCEAVLHARERIDGSGFPSAIKGSNVNALGNLVGLASSIAEKIIYQDMNFIGAVSNIIAIESTYYRQEYIELLRKI